MAAIDNLVAQISDKTLRERIQAEIKRMNKQKKFGLVFEEHLPECTPLYEIPVRAGSLVAKNTAKDRGIHDIYYVLSIEGDMATCQKRGSQEEPEKIPLDDLVSIAEFGDPIYPYLEPIDKIENAPDSDLWHTLIQADNYHALQLLQYLYAGKVDCIYIDPPYNTGAKDWKYNNDYVDGTDAYRHSKWLSFMEKRLKLAKKLLNPKDSVLIVTIDEKEYLHLGCLLEDLFPEANIQMVSSRINATGVIRTTEFTRVDEYIFFVMFGRCCPLPIKSGITEKAVPVSWHGLRRRDAESKRGTVKGGVAQFYPIYVNDKTCKIEKIGDALPIEQSRNTVEQLPGCTSVFPLKPDGTEMNWGVIAPVLRERLKKGYVRAKHGRNNPYTIEYLTSGYIKDIEDGKAIIRGYADDGSVIADYGEQASTTMPITQWNFKSHYAKDYGTKILRDIFADKRFSYSKSVYAVKDCISLFTENKQDALIVDFFAGSGTTLQAVNLLNKEDNGNRRCIMVTNNEVSEAEAKNLEKNGYKPGSEEWENLGIARYVAWPRTVCSIKGIDINGKMLAGTYGTYHEEYTSDEKRGTYKKIKVADNEALSKMNMSDGFKANAAFFKLGFLDKRSVAMGMQLQKLLPVLWMKAGAIGPYPESINSEEGMAIFARNKFAVLINPRYTAKFTEAINSQNIDVAYIITDYEPEYREIANGLHVKETYQLYRDYLNNFSINTGRL